ncbi:putative ribonuclease H-like domain-containing protein [Tanacetum coccineum]|uniref:Ribonuclease H-like domain-containing protein n=1 Tax=Tanacetum coccineum TaxID=301880 RepID=A0ABQ4WSC7_9ASTR
MELSLKIVKGIKREFSVARTPQQNKVAERKNRTLIEAAMTMLTDLLLPTTFWAEAINTTCYVQNRVLITKPHNKTFYELLIGRPSNLDLIRPFRCPLTILNTLDLLGKFEGKADEGFLVGYFVNSKVFRVFNTRTKKVEENLHVKFLENKSNVARSGPEWLFNIDSLTKSMNYESITAGNQTNGDAGIETNDNAWQAGQEKAADHEYILLPFLTSDSSSTQSSDDMDVDEVPSKGDEGINIVSGSNDQERIDSSTQDINTDRPSINTASTNINTGSLNINTVSPNDPNMPSLEETSIFDGAYDDEDVGAEADLNNLEITMNVSHIPTARIHKDHPKDQIIRDLNLSTQTRRMINFSEENAMVSYISKQRRTNHKDYQKCLFACFLSQNEPKKVIKALTDPSWIEAIQEELLQFKLQKAWYETLSTYLLENGYRRGTIDKNLFIKKDRGDILFVQVYVDDIIFWSTKKSLLQQKEDGIFISQDKYVADILKKFDFTTVKAASTLIETNKALNKDEEAEDVDIHSYRSMIGLLMYLTASRPDIMFVVCACARFQVTPKTSHLHIVKRIFRYLKGQPKLGLWYPRDSPFDLEAFSNSDYARASLDRKSTTGAEYVAAANCCGQVLWIQNQMLDYGFNFMNTKIRIDNKSPICIVNNPVFHSKTKHIEIRHHFIRDSYEKKLIQVIKIHTDHNVANLFTKAFDVSRKAKRTTKISQSSGNIHLVADETVYKEWEDKMERAATTASSLEAEQDSSNINRTQSMATLNESLP